jgi:hypothetical protein
MKLKPCLLWATLLTTPAFIVPVSGAITVPPRLEVTVPLETVSNPAFRIPAATYEWQTAPGSDDPAEVRWIFVPVAEHNDDFNETEAYIRNNPGAPEWSSWQSYTPPSTGTSWTSPAVVFGYYVFAVHGRDGGGAADWEFDLGRNMRRILVGPRAHGPLLRVTGDLIDEIITAVTVTAPTVIDVAGGTPLTFCWQATADSYGLPVTGYRYSWDVVDPDNENDWSMPFTPFAQTVECSTEQVFNFGTHMFYVETIDYDGFKSRVPIQINITIPTPIEITTWGRVKALYR